MPSQHHHVQCSLIIASLQKRLLPSIKNVDVISTLIQRIERWTGTTPELTQIICDAVVHSAPNIDKSQPEDSIDRIVKITILNDWKSSPASGHLGAIAKTLLQADNKDLLLLSYLKILQRGTVTDTDSPTYRSAYQALLACGLISASGPALKVTNTLYANVFDTHWIEQQIPGITRPVAIQKSFIEQSVTPKSATSHEPALSSKQPSTGSGLYSKLAVLTCCLAVLGAVISAYWHEPINQAAATQAPVPTMASLKANADALAPRSNGQLTSQAQPPSSTAVDLSADPAVIGTAGETNRHSQLTTDRVLFDQGVDHATNSRWLPMVREFCQLSSKSTYSALAKRQLEHWVKLYKEDIEIAQTTFTQEEGGDCSIVSEALAATR